MTKWKQLEEQLSGVFASAKIKADGYVVVIWDGINGEWHYTPEQAEKLEII